MANPSKAKGSRAERTLEAYARLRTGDERIARLTLHGRKDVGDVGIVYANGRSGVVEVKHYKENATDSQVAEWMGETEAEKDNLGVEWSFLVYHRPGKGMDMRGGMVPVSFDDNWCAMTIRSLLMVSGIQARTYRPEVLDKVVRMTVGQAFDLFCD